ncbi:hypothetical protein [Thiothrix winogradskyi]|uniref:Uncharacterized protein n=1 Tax=Thiothrix winogradskyi TaxID=96472 RepID=A0ABY3T6Q3_9GAMM|nr:hypothetical protein [Thiothrix winogradskyi]UJS26276.1 hypothetical protein L2Y54_09615 [Thiothrix winogradskyi]
MALQKIKPLDDFLFGARVYDAVKKTADDEFVIHPADNFIACALAMGAPLGNWSTVKDHFADSGAVMPTGARVIGSNGKVYQVGSGSDGMTDPTLGGAGWTDVSAGNGSSSGGGVNGSTPTAYSGDTAPAAGNVKVGDTFMTGTGIAAPFSKETLYTWNGTAWAFVGGAACAFFDWVAPAYNSGGGHAYNFGSATAVVNNLNVAVSGDTITLPSGGIYEVNSYINNLEVVDGPLGAYEYVGTKLSINLNDTEFAADSSLRVLGAEFPVGSSMSFWMGHTVTAKAPVGPGMTVKVFLETSRGKIPAGSAWRVSVIRVG